MKQGRLITKIVALRPRLEAEGVRHLALFGSRARGDHRENSDVDLLVETVEGRRFSLLDLVGVERIIADATGLSTNAVMRHGLTPNAATRVEQDAIELF